MTEKLLDEYKEKTFDDIKHIDEEGNEYWLARELMVALEYKAWRYFNDVINKAKLSCELSGNIINEHFVVNNKTILMPKNAIKEVLDYKLSRYACYLIVQNGNSRNKKIAEGQTYFAVQTRKQELTEEYFNSLDENKKRIITRRETIDKNKTLYRTAKESGVVNYGKFTNYGYERLYGGENRTQIAKRKGLNDNEEILDYMGSEELADNLFRMVQTESKLKNDKISDEVTANKTHYVVGRTVRETIEKLGGTMPENLPTPDKSIKDIENDEVKKVC